MITIESFENQIQMQKLKLELAVELWDKAWKSTDFMTKVLNFRGTPGTVGFSQNSKTNREVYETILKNSPNIKVRYAVNQVPNGSELASTDTATGLTTIQVRYLNTCTVFDLVETLSHEFTHTPEGGKFTHSYLCTRWMPWTLSRPQSVPYAIGTITKGIVETFK